MNENQNIINHLQGLATELDIEVQTIEHRPIGGRYKGMVDLVGIKNNLLITLTVDLDFSQETDGVFLKIGPLKEPSSDPIERIRESVLGLKDSFHMPQTDDWLQVVSKEIKIRVDLYN